MSNNNICVICPIKKECLTPEQPYIPFCIECLNKASHVDSSIVFSDWCKHCCVKINGLHNEIQKFDNMMPLCKICIRDIVNDYLTKNFNKCILVGESLKHNLDITIIMSILKLLIILK